METSKNFQTMKIGWNNSIASPIYDFSMQNKY